MSAGDPLSRVDYNLDRSLDCAVYDLTQAARDAGHVVRQGGLLHGSPDADLAAQALAAAVVMVEGARAMLTRAAEALDPPL